ncbi:uncharacterized protein F4822DRAFT_431666 [Hypoxylon trugodes]|uniref:uncharacterized protein n=1 Tax=Hypoxylon trugodes TaxID=326681 RepID=UPI0021948308|nr:uncharacterized protein F4822DRAFT_431666 [Hypoxylon trugodes]KAI1386799.1 hypothetical protein F4822DRAFT_431666 [Hypoxylon trugodes]
MSVDIEWIDLSHDHHGTNETRVRVRSHAMRATAASRKKIVAPGKRNLRRLPERPGSNESSSRASSSSPGDTASVDSGPVGTTVALSKSVVRLPTIASIPTMPRSGLEALAAETGIHILEISALTEIQCGWTACIALASQRNTFINLANRKPTYVYCLASRYGDSACFDNALRCVAVRAKRVLSPSAQISENIEAMQYVAALRSLQKAIDDPKERNRPEVLCAVNLLSLFELLQFNRHRAWSLHANGASRLIRTRGAASFTSEFDIRVLLSLVTPITNECFRHVEPCFFEEEAWQETFKSFVDNTDPFSGKSQLTINLTCIIVRGPRLARDVYAVVNSPDPENHPELPHLRERLKEFRRELLQWNTEYVSVAMKVPSKVISGKSPLPTPSEDIREELLATFYGLLTIGSRLMSALSTDLIDILEDEAVASATSLFKLEKEAAPINQWAAFYIRQRLVIARAVLNTTEAWRESAGRSTTNIIEYDKFNAWVSVLIEEGYP